MMDGKELKDALMRKLPIRYNGIDYLRIAEITYRVPENKLIVSAGLLDKSGRALIYAPPDKIEAIANESQ